MEQFKHISKEEYQRLVDAIPAIALLIANADGKIDAKEIEWAKELAHIRTFNRPHKLNEFYEDVEASLEQHRIENMLNTLPADKEEMEQILIYRLKKLNPVLAKLENAIGFRLYHSFVTFAKSIARSSGGFLGFLSVQQPELDLMTLPMLDEIEEEGLI